MNGFTESPHLALLGNYSYYSCFIGKYQIKAVKALT